MRNQFGCMRAPQIASTMPSARSRSLNMIKHRRHLTKILCERAIPNQVTVDAEELCHHHANHLSARRHRDARKLFDGGQVREIVHHAAQIVHAIGVRNIGVPRLALTHLLRAAVVEAYVRHGIDDLLAV